MSTASSLRAFVLVLIALLGLMALPQPIGAQQTGASTGFPVPRFVSVRSSPVNVRVGPGTRYEIAWVYVRPGIPVEITAEFDTWRRIRDVEGSEGWLHQNLLVGTRTAFVMPWAESGQIPLLARNTADAPVRAWLTPGLLINVRSCDGMYCDIRFDHTIDGRSTQFTGFVDQETLWGVYADEVFN